MDETHLFKTSPRRFAPPHQTTIHLNPKSALGLKVDTTMGDFFDKKDSALPPVAENATAVRPTSPSRRSGDLLVFGPSSTVATSSSCQDLFSRPSTGRNPELMGPLLRRKKVVSMPLGAGGDFFFRDEAQPQSFFDPNGSQRMVPPEGPRRVKQLSHTGHASKVSNLAEKATTPPGTPRIRSRQNSAAGVMSGVLRRKQVSLDLLGPNDFFAAPEEIVEVEPMPVTHEDEGVLDDIEKSEEKAAVVKLIRPLRFAPRVVLRSRAAGGHGAGGAAALPPVMENGGATIDDETTEAFESYTRASADLRLQLSSFSNLLKEEGAASKSVNEFLECINESQSKMESKEKVLKNKLIHSTTTSTHTSESTIFGNGKEETSFLVTEPDNAEGELVVEEEEDDGIIRATRRDKIKTGILFLIMLTLTVIVTTWETHLDEDSFIQGPVGMACVTDCYGNLETKDFFRGHNHFEEGQVIQLIMHMDPNAVGHELESHAKVEIYGNKTGKVKATREFGPPGDEERHRFEEAIVVDFEDPHEPHIINVYGSDANVTLSFTLSSHVQSPLADNSELVAALIMIFVYVFILLEVIHRTLVAIFGSMIALMFYFIMQQGETESTSHIMLHMEWSTLGLLFGMMLLVGELSHTGIFEWCAVRLLVASKGSFVRLLVLLCTLTAVASAFLDNVTTMLLVAPVTIDMCNILDVDPRPYLIGEVLLSNIGGTATLIGDPPNIIIGSSFEEIGFVDFIIHVLPCIFLFCIPVALVMVCYIYRYYLTVSKMRVLDTAKLKQTYPIYDQPRLMIAGTATFFVIVMFFLHPVHHKDTAWIALVGAFITIAFTNPHDVQEALRSHVEWDTLLFFAGLFVLVEVCAAMGLLRLIGSTLAKYIEAQPEENQLSVAITLLLWVSAITSAFLDNIPYTATMIPIVEILSDELPDTLPIQTLAWALSLGACLGGNGTLLGASANIVTAGISTNKGFQISFLNFLYPGMLVMIVTVAISNLYMIVRYVWV